jgi:hypothetical protein
VGYGGEFGGSRAVGADGADLCAWNRRAEQQDWAARTTVFGNGGCCKVGEPAGALLDATARNDPHEYESRPLREPGRGSSRAVVWGSAPRGNGSWDRPGFFLRGDTPRSPPCLRANSVRLNDQKKNEGCLARAPHRHRRQASWDRAMGANGTCYICYESQPPPIQSGCACRDEAGLVHIGCMVQVAVSQVGHRGVTAWWECHTCKQSFTGAMRTGLAEAWWARVRDAVQESAERQVPAYNLGESLYAKGQCGEAAHTPHTNTWNAPAHPHAHLHARTHMHARIARSHRTRACTHRTHTPRTQARTHAHERMEARMPAWAAPRSCSAGLRT